MSRWRRVRWRRGTHPGSPRAGGPLGRRGSVLVRTGGVGGGPCWDGRRWLAQGRTGTRPEAADQMAEVQQMAQDSQREVRDVVRAYREADLDVEMAGAR
ncbi:hypothetical protein DMH15_25585, partial [Streptomyces sp. WAC 06725]